MPSPKKINEYKKIEFSAIDQKAMMRLIEKIGAEQENVTRERDKIKAIMQSIGDGIIVINKKYIATNFNRAASCISGFSAKEIIGKKYNKILKFVSEKDKKSNDKFIKQAFIQGKIKEVPAHTNLIQKKGTIISIASTASPIKNKQGARLGCVVVFRDISRERAVDIMKTDFISVASHQLRAPLTAIKLFAEILLKEQTGVLNNQQKDYLRLLQNSTEQLIHLVNDFLNISRLETGRLKINPQPAQLEDFIQDIIKKIEPLKKDKKIKLFFKKPSPALPKILIDKILLRQVIHNLIANAIKYSKKENSRVEINIEKRPEDYLIAIKDEGIGIASETQSQIFTKFFRAENAVKLQSQGTGLGLYVAKMIIEATGGKLWFKSKLNQGSIFYISLLHQGMIKKSGAKGLAV